LAAVAQDHQEEVAHLELRILAVAAVEAMQIQTLQVVLESLYSKLLELTLRYPQQVLQPEQYLADLLIMYGQEMGVLQHNGTLCETRQ
jgi:hypothetical protein